MSNESKSTNQACQSELSDAELSQASGGKSRDYASTQAPGGQCYDGIMINKTPNFQWTTTVSSGKDAGTTTDAPSNPTL